MDPSHAREKMVQTQIAQRGITDPRVLDAMRIVPRERFVTPDQNAHAYDDRALAVEMGQTISQPYIVAYMTDVLEIEPHHRVLEIGTGTGYQTAVLARLAAHVYSVERLAPLSEQSGRRLAELDIKNVTLRVGDGSLGWPAHAPFDRILVAAGAPRLVQPLVDQLADGGRLILPLGPPDSQQLTIVVREGEHLIERSLIAVRFVKLIGEAGFHEDSV